MIKIGKMGKPAELISDGMIDSGTALTIGDGLLDGLVAQYPETYLRELEGICASMKNPVGIKLDSDGVVFLTVAVLSGNVSMWEIKSDIHGAVLRIRKAACAELTDGWMIPKQVVRSRKYRRSA